MKRVDILNTALFLKLECPLFARYTVEASFFGSEKVSSGVLRS